MKKLVFEKYKDSLSKFLFEQEEATEEEGGEAAEEGGEEPTEEGGEDAEEDEEDPAAAEEEDGEAAEEVPADTASLDDDIESVLIDFETSARKEAELSVSEGRVSVLYEQADDLDVGSFAADVARLVKNYDNLLDIEDLLVKKSIDFLKRRYDEKTASDFEDALETQHDITTKDSPTSLESNLETPLAVGATSATE